MKSLPHIPELVLDKIIRFLPTKAAIETCLLSKEWLREVNSSINSLNFDENDDFERHDRRKHRRMRGRMMRLLSRHMHLHRKFVNFLKEYLIFHKRLGRKDPLDKFRLHTRMFLKYKEWLVVSDWLDYARQRGGVKELDICLDYNIEPLRIRTLTQHLVKTRRRMKTKFHRELSAVPLVFKGCVDSLISLKLACVTFLDLHGKSLDLLPSYKCLKNLSLKAVRFATDDAPRFFLRQCPSIENLSLTYCSFPKPRTLSVCCKRLKYLEVKYCEIRDIRVDEAFNLETFSFVSLLDWNCDTMILKSAFNLKHINVSVDNNIRVFSLLGCHHTLEASIMSKVIKQFELFDGYSGFKIAYKSESDQATIDHATILDEELIDQEGMMSPHPTCIARLLKFNERFGCFKIASLYNESSQVLTYPKTFSTSLQFPKTSTLEVVIPSNLPHFGSKHRYKELLKMLRGIAPRAKILRGAKSMDLKFKNKNIDKQMNKSG